MKTTTVTLIGPFSKGEVRRVEALMLQFMEEHPRKSFIMQTMDDDDLDRMLAERYGVRKPVGATTQ